MSTSNDLVDALTLYDLEKAVNALRAVLALADQEDALLNGRLAAMGQSFGPDVQSSVGSDDIRTAIEGALR